MKAEKSRIREIESNKKDWRLWGPYVSDRQWGTVREDYSEYGTAWDYVPYDKAKSYAYRWGEDGIAGICDKLQTMCLSFAFWNGHDRELKERLFGLSGPQGNHGEDVKEIYFYRDNVPSHSYMSMLYKYPIKAFPYDDILKNNSGGKDKPEYEIFDSGIFSNKQYFDILVEYAKDDFNEILVKVSVTNKSSDPAPIDIVPLVYFRNTWAWDKSIKKPKLTKLDSQNILCESSLGAYLSVVFPR